MVIDCPNCYKPIKTANKGDIETCTNCFTTSYLDKNGNSVKEGYNKYMAKMNENRIK